MTDSKAIENFLSSYSKDVFDNALKLREIILKNLPAVQEQIDYPAKMIFTPLHWLHCYMKPSTHIK